jgi:DNA modification methylase/superfamily II DNA or RNA helicase
MSEYETFLTTKGAVVSLSGPTVPDTAINQKLFPFQRDLVKWAIRKGRAAVFADTGLGKTFIQLEWARLLGKRTLIIAPLSVARQTVREGQKIGVEVRYVRSQADIAGDHSLYITNYEMMEVFDFSQFGAVVLDESSILKSVDGKTRKRLLELCAHVPYRLACTATPAPNDYIELGNHAEFLGICTQNQMLAMFFVNANKEHTFLVNGDAYRKKGTNKAGTEWRLKHHAEHPFYKWLSSWACYMTKPSDLGYDDNGFILPPMNILTHVVRTDYHPDDQLFFSGLRGIGDRARVRKETVSARLGAMTELLQQDQDQWVIWCGLDAEQRAIEQALGDGCLSVYGSLDADEKERRIESWLSGERRVLLSKARICGFGLNLQQAHHMAFMGLNDSWEMWYQCIRREWRFGQLSPVDVHVVMSEQEQAIYQNVQRKEAMATRLRAGMIEHVRDYERGELNMNDVSVEEYQESVIAGDTWEVKLGDSCERLKELAGDSIDLSVYSPPFADLYTYSNSERDLGNSRGQAEFFDHYAFIIREMLRVTKPGRLTCVHTSDIPAMSQRDGYIGVKDFPGETIRAYEKEGWVFTGRAFVQKNPQAQAIRTKSKALLFVQIRKDSTDSRPALVDQILLFTKPGENATPVNPVANGDLDNEAWIEWAHGIWLGIRETDTLQGFHARAADDEKHICPLQLGTIERCIKLWSNPGETVLSPFAGIGSEGYVAVKLGRRFQGIELKRTYWELAVRNLREAEAAVKQTRLF